MKEEKHAFLVRYDYYSSVYDNYLEDSNLIKRKKVEIYIEIGDAKVEENDLALILMTEPKNVSGLLAIGRFGNVTCTIEPEKGETLSLANVNIDFFFSRKYKFDEYFDFGKLCSFFPDLDKTGEYCECLPQEQVQNFVEFFVAQFIRLEKPNTKIFFNKKSDFRKVMCSYINDFAPVLKKLICSVYGVDSEKTNLILNKNKIEKYPKFCEDTESLRDLLIPESVKPYELPAISFNEIQAEDLIIKFDSRYERNENCFKYKTETCEGFFTLKSANSPPTLNGVIDENGNFKITNVLPFDYLPINDLAMAKEIQTDDNENTGIVEIKIGSTPGKIGYAYRIIKIKAENEETIYKFNLQLDHWDTIVSINGSFRGNAAIKQRTEKIYDAMNELGLIGENQMDGWLKDPSGRNYNKGFLMNKSEEYYFDDVFPESPLSLCRQFIKFLIENN